MLRVVRPVRNTVSLICLGDTPKGHQQTRCSIHLRCYMSSRRVQAWHKSPFPVLPSLHILSVPEHPHSTSTSTWARTPSPCNLFPRLPVHQPVLRSNTPFALERRPQHTQSLAQQRGFYRSIPPSLSLCVSISIAYRSSMLSWPNAHLSHRTSDVQDLQPRR